MKTEQPKIDRRKTYFLVLDVEAANMTDDALVYDLGFAVCDKKGNIYERHSYLTYDIFCLEKQLMDTCYYAKKLPIYYQGLQNKEFKIVNLLTARSIIQQICKKYKIKQAFAYNARFDRDALNTTLRYVTKSKYRWFLPYGVQVNCIWHMACQTILSQKSFFRFAKENGFVSGSGNFKTSAEVAYAYITNTPKFEERHTGLADVEIEVAILAKCIAQHKAMKKFPYRVCWRIPTKAAQAAGFLPPPKSAKPTQEIKPLPEEFQGDKRKVNAQKIFDYCAANDTLLEWFNNFLTCNPDLRFVSIRAAFFNRLQLV